MDGLERATWTEAELQPHIRDPVGMGTPRDQRSASLQILSQTKASGSQALGSIVLKEREPIQDIRGGILADEPGLGKTATILSLVMRTRGVISTPPDSCRVQWGVGVDQNNIGYY